MDELYKEFGRGLKAARRDGKPKLTQQQLADRVGLSRTSITNIESGRQQVALHQVYLLASALGRQPAELLPVLSAAALEATLPEDVLASLRDDEAGREAVVRFMSKSAAVRSSTSPEVAE